MTDREQRHVGLFRNNFLPYSETFIHDELCHHVRYRATVFARQWRNKSLFRGHRVVAVEEIPDHRRRTASAWYGLTGVSGRFDAAFQSDRPDVIHAHFGHNGTYALGYARKWALPLAVSLHGRDVTILLGRDKYLPGYWKYLLQYRRLFEEADVFLAASTELKSLIESVGCPPEKVVVHRLGIDIDRFTPADLRDKAPATVVMVGRFVEKKGHVYGIRAVRYARDKGLDPKLVLIGEGPLLSSMKALVKTLELDANVVFKGALPHDEVQRHMQSAAVVMAPSVVAANLDRESGIIVAKEAAATGIPVIGTLHGGIPDIIDDGVTGYLVAERDWEALGDRLTRLLTDDATRIKMGRAARRKMEQEYDIRDRVTALEGIYDEIIARRAKRNGGQK